MEKKKQKIINLAKELGFIDAKFVSVTANEIDSRLAASLKKEPSCALVLFYPYGATPKASPGQIALSNYYPASHSAYMYAKKMAGRIVEQNIQCVHAPNVDLKTLAGRSGGYKLRNHLYAHLKYGSFVTLQALLFFEDFELDEGVLIEAPLCASCKRCVSACPTNAIGADTGAMCLRARMGKNPMEEGVRPMVFQLLGCEICQEVCPYNKGNVNEPLYFDVAEILSRKAIPKIKEMSGANMARTNIVLAQTMAYAANQGMAECVPALKELQKDLLLREMATWAIAKLTNCS